MRSRSLLQIFCLIILTSSACTTTTENTNSDWHIAFKHDEAGKPILGSKQILFDAIRQGKTVRIGWGWKNEQRGLTIEHLADPIWLAIVDQKEVIAHLEPQVLSHIDWNDGTADYEDETLLSKEWRVVINTNGEFDAVWYDRAEHKRTRRAPQTQMITWFVDQLPIANTTPLFQAGGNN